MVAINDIETYTKGMRRSIEDKLFFLPYLSDVGNFVDFGCADGTLLSYVHEINPEINLYGIDVSEPMLKRCQHTIPEAHTYLNTMPRVEDIYYADSALNLSSVLHELYSYSSGQVIDRFWNYINECGYRYVFIRDMCCDALYRTNTRDLLKVLSDERYQDQIREFQENWGSLEYQKNLVHFLLKYRYKSNWDREVRENYLPITADGINDILRVNGNYHLVYEERYTLPYLKDKVRKDFGINLTEPTHMKLIFKIKE